MIEFDNEQTAVIKNNSKNLIVIAGAGCGKTTLISGKVNYLVHQLNINPKEILVISYTNESVLDLIKKINYKVDIKTFHKFGYEIIKKYFNYKIKDNLLNILNDYFNRDIFFTKNCFEYVEYLNNYYKKNDVYDEIIISIFKMAKLKYKKIFFSYIFKYKNKKYFILFKNINIKISNIIYLKKEKNIGINLIKKLKKIGINNYSTIKENNNFINNSYEFINKYKSIYIDKEGFKKIQEKNIGNNRITNYLKIILNAYLYYEKNKNCLDFNDIINLSINILDNRYKLDYKYLIVDEFQDISPNRMKLLKVISKKNVNIIVLGDDWQSIYSFSGSNLNLFINFQKNIGNCSKLNISRTYRNSQELIDVAGNFIMKNKKQFIKKLYSDKNISNPIVIEFYKSNQSLKLYNLISKIYNNNKILLIGRYNFDIKEYIDNKYFKLLSNKVYCIPLNIEIDFKTAHASKGLTYDEVIIINAKDELYGFPSYISDSIELSILKEQEEYYLSEERRLFYVALTRTKNRTYILTPIDNPSIFVIEIMNYKNVLINSKKNIKKIILCKNCGYVIYKKNKVCPLCKNNLHTKT